MGNKLPHDDSQKRDIASKGVSRRSFLGFAGATGLVAAAGLAGCNSPAPSEPAQNSTEAANSEAGAKKAADASQAKESADSLMHHSWEVAPDPIPDSQIDKTLDCDICIVGAGASGVPAALSAADAGAKTIVLQKADDVDTNGWVVGQFNSKRAKDVEKPQDLSQIYAKHAEFANGRDKASVVKLWLERSGEVLDYIFDTVPGNEPLMYQYGDGFVSFAWYKNNDFSTRYGEFLKMMKNLQKKSEELGAEYLWETPAEQLVVDNGKVTGVIAKDKDGKYIKVNAAKGVILAAGDISNNEEMKAVYAPFLVGLQDVKVRKTHTGDGLKMGLGAGAALDRLPLGIMAHFDPTWMPEGNAPYSGNPWLRVNKNGERFANENLVYQSVVTSVIHQPDMVAYQIVDKNWPDHSEDYMQEDAHSRKSPDPLNDWADAVKRGAIIEANSIEELADKLGLPKENLVKTVERYNELVDKGKDEDFGVRSDFFVWNGIKEAPFYGIKRTPGTLATVGGLQINDKLQVLNKDQKPIDGLYAVGNTSGSFFGTYYSLYINGNSLSRAMVFGALAPRSILGTMDEPMLAKA